MMSRWGCKHEKAAKDMYFKNQSRNHQNLEIRDSGLCINPEWLFIGASPDGIISCQCHGKGVLEVKCPYCHHDDTIEYAVSKDAKFCCKSMMMGLYILTMDLHTITRY